MSGCLRQASGKGKRKNRFTAIPVHVNLTMKETNNETSLGQRSKEGQPIPKPYGGNTSTLTNKSIRLPYLDLEEERLACLLFRRIQKRKKSKFPTTTSVLVPISSLYLFLRSVLGLAFKALINSREVQDKAHQCFS
ncbi:hypothetical protein K1719_043874 [Acacia pycnantha]|nr:hypothetical protein K1719_043874 [Acacia pycnantha]